MKKAKIFLGAIAVLAIVGGALAFKAKTLGFQVYTCVTPSGQDPICQISANGAKFTDIGLNRVLVTEITSDPSADGAPCALSCPNDIDHTLSIKPE